MRTLAGRECPTHTLMGDGIVSTVHKWVAPQQTPERQRDASYCAMPLHSFQRILRTAWDVTARRKKKGRERLFIPAKGGVQRSRWNFPELQVRGFSFVRLFSTATNALATSFLISAKRAVNRERFGLMTTSAATAGANPVRRTASRS
jgi:hypothetical protein